MNPNHYKRDRDGKVTHVWGQVRAGAEWKWFPASEDGRTVQIGKYKYRTAPATPSECEANRRRAEEFLSRQPEFNHPKGFNSDAHETPHPWKTQS